MKLFSFPGIHEFIPDFAHTKIILAGSIGITTLQAIFNKYIFSDWEFLPFFIVLIVVDTITGVWKSLIKRNFNSYTFGGVFSKAILYAFFLVVVHNLSNFSNKESVILGLSWVEQACYAAMIIREAVSIIENIGAIKPNLLPKWIVSRLKQLNEKDPTE